jgi:hypothetical protein
MGKTRLWRVDAIHTDGYHAQHLILESEEDRKCSAEAEALKTAKKKSRFSELSGWRLEVTLLNKKKFNGKWYSEEEYDYKTRK